MAIVATALPAPAQAAVSVHRTASAATVQASAPVAIVATSPFDDAGGLLSDPQPCFYLATDDFGSAVDLSVQKNPLLDTVRVSFDDGNPASAPVDSARSTVVVTPSTIPADGLTLARVTIVPRDADGIALGTGLSLAVDGPALWPGMVFGPLVDEGDGSYTAYIVSSAPGVGGVWVTVEGIALDDEPAVEYEAVGGPFDLRELAILSLQALTGPGGAFDQLALGLGPADPGAEEVDTAAAAAVAALDLLVFGDYGDDDEAVGEYLARAVAALEAALDQPGAIDPAAIEALADALLDAARMIAVFHIDQGTDACGECSTGSKLCDAERFLLKGDEERQAPSPDWTKVVEWYAKAVEKARKELLRC